MSKPCKNCQFDWQLHHADTLQCPTYADSATWRNTTFEDVPTAPPVEAGLPDPKRYEPCFDMERQGYFMLETDGETVEAYEKTYVESSEYDALRARLLGATGGELRRAVEAMEWAAKCMSERRALEGAMNGVDFSPAKLETELRECAAALRPRLPAAREGSPQEQKDKG